MTNKRIFSRIPLSLMARVDLGETIENYRILNLSLQGILLETDQNLARGRVVPLQIITGGGPSGLTIPLKGRVVRAMKNETALRFVDTDHDSFIHLKNIVAYNLGDPDLVEDEFRNFLRNTAFLSPDDGGEDRRPTAP